MATITTPTPTTLPSLIPSPHVAGTTFVPKLTPITVGVSSGSPQASVIANQRAGNIAQTNLINKLSGGRRWKSMIKRQRSNKKNIRTRKNARRIRRIVKKSKKNSKKSRKSRRRKYGGAGGTITLPQTAPQAYHTPAGGTTSQTMANNVAKLSLQTQVAGQYDGNVARKGGSRAWGCMS